MLSDDIKVKQVVADKTEKDIDEVQAVLYAIKPSRQTPRSFSHLSGFFSVTRMYYVYHVFFSYFFQEVGKLLLSVCLSVWWLSVPVASDLTYRP